MNQAPGAVRFIFFTILLDVLGIGLIIPVAPRLVENLQGEGESAAAYSVAILGATYAAMQFIFAPILGSLSDRVGRRPVILISLLGSGLDYIAAAFAPTLAWLFVTRAINGISGANITAASAYIADVTPPEKRAAGFGMMGAAFGIGFVVGPLMGGVLGSYDLRWPFLAAGGLSLLNALYGYFVLPESLKPEHRRPFSFARANPISSLRNLQKYPLVLGLSVVLFLANIAQFALHTTWVLYTKHRYGWSPRDVGFSLFAVGISAAIVQGFLARKIIPKIGEKRAVLFGLAIGAVAYLGYGLATQGWMLIAILLVGSLGGIFQPASQSLVTQSVRPDEQGGVQGAITSLQCLAGILGPAVGGSLFGYFARRDGAQPYIPGASYFASSILCLMSLGVAIWVFRRWGPRGTEGEASELSSVSPASVVPATVVPASATPASPSA